MYILDEIIKHIFEITKNLDSEVNLGYDLSKWSDLMKFLHALQIQAQALIDIVQVISSQLGLHASTYLDAGKVLLEKNLLTNNEFKIYRAIVGFRNILVHQYRKANVQIVNDILRNRKYRAILELAKKLYEKAKDHNLDP